MSAAADPGRSRPPHASASTVLLVVAGGIAGTLLRALVDVLIPQAGGLPWPTLAVNLTGAFALGLLFEALSAPRLGRAGARLRLALGTGLIGSYTTYSALAVETTLLLGAGRIAEAIGYAAVTLVAGGALSFAGIVAGGALRRRSEKREGPDA